MCQTGNVSLIITIIKLIIAIAMIMVGSWLVIEILAKEDLNLNQGGIIMNNTA